MVSVEAIRRCGLPGLELEVEDDTSFNLSQPELLALAGLDRMRPGRYHLVALRRDAEHPIVPSTLPASGVVIDPARDTRSFQHWLRVHLAARSITSNRLHSAIVGAVAGKPVTLTPGSYHKNRSVWEQSLRRRGVCWIDETPLPGWPLRVISDRWSQGTVIRTLRFILHGIPLR